MEQEKIKETYHIQFEIECSSKEQYDEIMLTVSKMPGAKSPYDGDLYKMLEERGQIIEEYEGKLKVKESELDKLIEEYRAKVGAASTPPSETKEVEEKMSLDEAKDKIAKTSGFDSWTDMIAMLYKDGKINMIDNCYNEAMTLSATNREGWVKVEDRLPEHNQRVYLWMIPPDGSKEFMMPWTWERNYTKDIKIGGSSVSHWRLQFTPPSKSK